MTMRYHDAQREIQDRFDTRRLADRLSEQRIHAVIREEDAVFITARDMFFLATCDAEGRPQCSYKGGDPGFVRVLDEHTLAFPCYDGNGMYLSMGNVLAHPDVGMLFIDFEGQSRLRLNGRASIDWEDPLARRLPRGAVHRPRRRDGGVPELPALHPPLPARGALALRAPCRHADPRPRMEEPRLGPRRAAEGAAAGLSGRQTSGAAPRPGSAGDGRQRTVLGLERHDDLPRPHVPGERVADERDDEDDGEGGERQELIGPAAHPPRPLEVV